MEVVQTCQASASCDNAVAVVLDEEPRGGVACKCGVVGRAPWEASA